MNLFIIGNGFDLAHGLPTRYWDFRTFLEDNYRGFLKDFEDKYYLWGAELKEFLWNDFEFNLANLEEDVLFEEMYQSTDLGLESGNIGIQDTLTYHFRDEFRYIEDLTIYLKEWIKEVNNELDGLNRKTSYISENNQDIFINFNYTTTLEKVYNISRQSVLHIHGVVDSDDHLVLGHSNSDRIEYFSEKRTYYQNKFDEQSAPIYNILEEYCYKTYKNVDMYMDQLIMLNFNPIKKIRIVGHSLSTVDLPYFKEIKKYVNEDIEWYIYYYDESQIVEFRDKLLQIGIDEHQIHLEPSSTFYDLPILELT